MPVYFTGACFLEAVFVSNTNPVAEALIIGYQAWQMRFFAR